MSDLTKEKCEACKHGAPKASEVEIEELRKQIPHWTVETREDVQRLERIFDFADFAGALAFTDKIGRLAEEEGHHPAILTEWGRATVSWWTHKIRGLHRNDFIMAAKTDRIFEGHKELAAHTG